MGKIFVNKDKCFKYKSYKNQKSKHTSPELDEHFYIRVAKLAKKKIQTAITTCLVFGGAGSWLSFPAEGFRGNSLAHGQNM